MLTLTGTSIPDQVRALVEALRSLSFRIKNSSRSCFSWLNTFSTFCPAVISSTKPLTAASASCCALKYFLLHFPLYQIKNPLATKNSNTINVRRALKTNSMLRVPISIKKLWISMENVPFNASCTVSTSFVKRLISSPWVCASK